MPADFDHGNLPPGAQCQICHLDDYQGTTDPVLGPIGSSIYAVCIEPNEYIGGVGDTNLYEIASLAGAPTSQTPGIEAAEVDIIERVLSEKFRDAGVERDFSFMERQSGMFSFLGLSVEQVQRLRDEFSIYTVNSARVNIASFNERNIDYFVGALKTVL